MYVYDYSASTIPRCHYKWAGIKRIEPVQPVWLQTLLREHQRPPQRAPYNKKMISTDGHSKTKNIVKKLSVVMYNKDGRVQDELKPPSLEIYC